MRIFHKGIDQKFLQHLDNFKSGLLYYVHCIPQNKYYRYLKLHLEMEIANVLSLTVK